MPSTSWHFTIWSATGSQLTDISCSAEIDPARIYGARSAFGPSLLLPYEVIWHPGELSPKGAQMLSLEGWASGANDPANAYGVRIPAQVSTPPYTPLVMPLSAEQIEAIEDLRRGDAVILKLTLSGLAVLPNARVQALHRVQDRYGGQPQDVMLERSDLHRMTTQGETSLRIEREQWLKILEQFGTGRRRLVELPVPALPKIAAAWAICLRYLDQATQHHRQGEYEQAIRFCRDVVQGIAVVIGETWNIGQKQGQSFEGWTKEIEGRLENAWPTEKESPAMLSSLLFAAWNWTSPNAHYQTDIPKREEAAFALSLATDLLMFASQLVTAHPRTLDSDQPSSQDARQ